MYRALLVDGADFLAPTDILLSRQRVRAHPDFDNAHGDNAANDLAADAKHVRVIVLSGELRAQRVLAHTCEDAAKFVGDHRAAVAHAIHKDAALALTLRHGLRRRVHEVGKVAPFLVVRAEVHDLVALVFQHRL